MKNELTNDHLSFLKLIAHDLRWDILAALAASDLRVHEIIQQVNQPQNLVSYHLQKLKQAGLVDEHHSLADARSIYYHLNYESIRTKLQSAGAALLPLPAGVFSVSGPLHQDPIRVLFVCTHNSARSQMAEGLLREWGGASVEVFSAGNDPGRVHELAVQVMKEKHIDIEMQRSKGLEEFIHEPFTYVITVCDRARENCPAFPGGPIQIHWSIPDPTTVVGSQEEKLQTFRSVANQLADRVRFLLERIIVTSQ